MTVEKVADYVCFYCRMRRDEFIDGNGNDYVIQAINNARRAAESQHDFVLGQSQVQITVDPDSGGDYINGAIEVLPDGTLGSPVTEANGLVKTVTTAYIKAGSTSQCLIPIYVDPQSLIAGRFREKRLVWHGVEYDLLRYPGDPRQTTGRSMIRGFFNGSVFRLTARQTSPIDVLLDVNRWRPNYQSNSVFVETASINSNSVTITLPAPTNLGEGSKLLGRTVLSVIGSTVTLAGNANENVDGVWKHFTSMNGASATGENVSDIFTNEGYQYLCLAGVVEANMFARQFAYRTEGYVSPPDKERDNALNRLVEWDNFLWEQGRKPMATR